MSESYVAALLTVTGRISAATWQQRCGLSLSVLQQLTIDAARKVCGAGGLCNGRVSVRLSVRSIAAAATCGWFAAELRRVQEIKKVKVAHT